MIARLTGTVLDVELTRIVLDVHGIGYLVFISGKHTYTHGE